MHKLRERAFVAFGATLLMATLPMLVSTGSAEAASGDNLRLITADTTGTACASGGTGVGLAFDGTDLLVSCAIDSKVTAVRPSDGSQVAVHAITGASSLGALAWDEGRHLLWACSEGNRVGTIDLTTDAFTFVFVASDGCPDGLAYDGSDDTIWTSPDASSPVSHYTTAGALIGAFPVSLGGFGNSGIAVGGPLLFLANNGGQQIYTSDKTFSSPTVLFASLQARLEYLECDNITFAPLGAIWSKDAFDNQLNAWEVPAGSCSFGGAPPEITATPPEATNDVGATHTVSATVTQGGNPLANAAVHFDVTGANTTSGDATTGPAGEPATFTYTGTNLGDDTITACYDANSNQACDVDEVAAQVIKHWTKPCPHEKDDDKNGKTTDDDKNGKTKDDDKNGKTTDDNRGPGGRDSKCDDDDDDDDHDKGDNPHLPQRLLK